MGLLDVLNGMQNGPRGQRDPKSGGMSPITMALLGLLAYKTFKNFGANQPQANPMGRGSNPLAPGGSASNADGGLGGMLGGGLGGGLGDLLKGGLGGLLGGAAAGSVVSGGLSDLLKQFQQSGHGEVADTWVGTGPNKSISPNDLATALGADRINMLADQTGMSQQELVTALSQHLPDLVNHLTPDGRLPTEQEVSRMI